MPPVAPACSIRGILAAVLGMPCVVASLAIVLADVPVTEPATGEASVEARNATASAAYADAQQLVDQRRYDEAIVKLDLASDLEPTWAEPVKLRAEVFGKLAEKHEPSAAFTSARAVELQRLLELEPGVDADRRKNEIAALQQQAQKAEEIERRHRKLAVPAALVIMASVGLLAAGAMLYGMKPRETLQPQAWRQERRDKAGIALMAMGGILLPPAIALGVLAGKQARRDSAVRDFNVETDRPPRASVAIAPTGVVLRF